MAAKKFDRCLLHIGAEKTGSTSLQRFFGLNKAPLSAEGYYIPETLAPYAETGNLNHIGLAALHCAQDRNDLLQIIAARGGPTDRTNAAAELSKEIEVSCRRDSSLPSTLVLSNEHVQSRLRSAEELIRLREFLELFARRVEIVIYIRAQHETSLSVSATAIKNGATEQRLFPNFDTANGFDEVLGVDRSYFDYLRTLETVASVFGNENLQVRLFEEKALLQKNLVDDFVLRMGLDPSKYLLPRKENGSFDQQAITILVELNRYLDRSSETQSRIRESLIAFLEEKRRGRGFLPARRDAEAFFNLFSASNEAVRARWFSSRPRLFECDFSVYPDHENTCVSGVAEAASLFAEFLAWNEYRKAEIVAQHQLKLLGSLTSKRSAALASNCF